MKVISEFIVALSTMIGMLIFLIFSLLGIEHTEDNPSPLFSIIIVAVNLYTIAWIMVKEATKKSQKRGGGYLYIIVPSIIIFLYGLEYLINPEVEKSSAVKHVFIQWGAQCVAPFYTALFCYRHNRFDILTKNLEVIMLLGAVALVLNIPKIALSGVVQLGGSGGHQEIAYSGAFFLCIILTYLFCELKNSRYEMFGNVLFRVFEIILIPVLVLIILMSGGRGGALLMIVGSIVCSFMFARKYAKRYFILVLSVVLVGAIGFSRNADRKFMGIVDSGIERTFNYINGGKINTEAEERTEIRKLAFESISESPIVGHGLFGGYADMYKRAGGYSHNLFYDVLIHGGFLYLLIFIRYFIRAYRSAYFLLINDRSKAMLLIYGLYVVVQLMFSGTYFWCPQFWFFITFSLLSYKETLLLIKQKK